MTVATIGLRCICRLPTPSPTESHVITQARLRKLGANILAVTNDFMPPIWAAPYHRGTFSKLAVLRLTAFEKVIFLDNDCQVIRNIDHLADAPTPSFAFHAPDLGLNTGVMVISPDLQLAQQALDLLKRQVLPSSPVHGNPRTGMSRPVQQQGASDQEVWVALFNLRHLRVHELPSGYNFRWSFEMSHSERCRVHIVHLTSHAPPMPLASKFQALSCHLAGGDKAAANRSSPGLDVRKALCACNGSVARDSSRPWTT